MREPTEQKWNRRIRERVEQTRDAPIFSVSGDARLRRNPFHPGEHIRGRFEKGMTVGEAAAVLFYGFACSLAFRISRVNRPTVVEGLPYG